MSARPVAPSPMLATLGTLADITTDDDWAFEMKWDGIRAIATVFDGEVHLVSRNAIDQTERYPELAELSKAVTGNAVLDGEIVAFNAKGRPDFGLLQARFGLTKAADVAAAMKKAPVVYLVFDILEADGVSLVAREYDERRATLLRVVTPSKLVQVPPAFDGDVTEALSTSLELGLEGVMAKKRDGTYSVGRRSRSWIKLKHHLDQEVVIGGWRPGAGRRANQVGSLLMGIPGENGLDYVGRVGTGFSDRDLDDLTARMSKLARATSPFTDLPAADRRDAHFVSPTLVGEVEFAEWTKDGRLRQPSWRGWRPDKKPAQVVREQPAG